MQENTRLCASDKGASCCDLSPAHQLLPAAFSHSSSVVLAQYVRRVKEETVAKRLIIVLQDPSCTWLALACHQTHHTHLPRYLATLSIHHTGPIKPGWDKLLHRCSSYKVQRTPGYRRLTSDKADFGSLQAHGQVLPGSTAIALAKLRRHRYE